jgi:hypothetical protein
MVSTKYIVHIYVPNLPYLIFPLCFICFFFRVDALTIFIALILGRAITGKQAFV